MNIEISGLSHQGSRSHNEDSLFLPPQNNAAVQTKGYLFIVADGVGGHQAGEVASKMAVDVISQTYYGDPNPDVRSSLQAAIEKANNHIFQAAKRNNDDRPRTMATTLAIAVLKGMELTVGNVGDSRVYLVGNGRVEQLTHDHSWVAEQIRAGILTTEQAKNHPQKNVVTRSLGHKLEVQVDIHPPRTIGPGHTIVLCSDGLPAVVEDSDIGQIVSQSRQPNEITKKLVDLTLERGAPDNVTTIAVSFGGPAAAVAVAAPPTQRTISTSMAQVRPPTPKKSGKTLPILLLIGAVFLVILLLGGIGLFLWFSRSSSEPAATPVAKSEAIIEPTTVVTAAPTDTPMPVAVATAITPTPTLTVEVAAETALTETQMPGSDPILSEPQDGAVLSSNNPDPIFLQWSGRELNVANGEQFVVFIRDAEGKNITLSNQGITQDSKFPLPNDLKSGQYIWLVVVQQKKTAGGFEDVNYSKISSFSIRPSTSAVQPQPIVETTPIIAVSKDPAVFLEKPAPNELFASREAIIEFVWSESSSPLATDEYYVLIINHKDGEDRIWQKTNRYLLPDDKRWLIEKGPDLFWQVVVAQQRTGGANEAPYGAERSEYSERHKFIWPLPVEGGGSKDENNGSQSGSETGGDGGID